MNFGSISKEGYSGQAGACIEGHSPDAGDAIGNRDALQACASKEGIYPNAGNAVRYRGARQAGAATEGVIPDAGDAIRNRDARQAGASGEGLSPDAGDWFAFNTSGDDQITRCLFIAASDSDRITFDLIF